MTATAPPQPATLDVHLEQIPVELQTLDRWVLWRWELREDKRGEPKWTKPPHQPDGRYARSDTPSTWTTFAHAVAAYNAGGFDGLGVAMTADDDLAGVDLDHCAANGVIDQSALDIAQAINSYTEISPSGTGLRILVHAKLPPSGRKRGDVECYETGRYLTITGHKLEPAPATIEHRQAEIDAFHARHFPAREKTKAPTNGTSGHLTDSEILDLIRGSKQAAKFDALYRGDDSMHNDDTSVADLALVSQLAFYTQDEAQLDRIFQGSSRARDKWTTKHASNGSTYGQMTIRRALDQLDETYTPPTEGPELVDAPGTDPQQGTPAPEAEPELVFTTLKDLRAQIAARGPRRYLLRGIWPTSAYGVHAAEMKAQKSWNMLDLAVAVASGTPWLGHVPVDDPGPVIIFWGEGDDAGLVRRIDAIARSRDLDPDELPIVICCRVPHLGQQHHLDLFAAELDKTAARLVILDPLYLAARGAKSSDLYDMGAHLETVQHICQRAHTALVVVTHYNRKSGRGAGRITGAGPAEWGRVLIGATVQNRHTNPDTKATSVVTELDVIGGEIPDSNLRIHRRIAADDPDDLDSPLHYEVDVTETDGRTVDLELKPAEEKLLEALRATATPLEPQPVNKLVDWIAEKYGHGLTRETCSKSLNRLAELDLADGAGDTGKPKLWWPMDEGDTHEV